MKTVSDVQHGGNGATLDQRQIRKVLGTIAL